MRATRQPILGLGEILWDLLPAGRQPGGAPFNFTFHCHQLGWPAVPISRLGNDELGQALRAEVRGRLLPDSFLQTDEDHPTGTVSVTVDTGGQPTYTIYAPVAWDFLVWTDDLAMLIAQSRALCFGTLAQRHPVARATIHEMLHHANACEVLVVLDLNLRQEFYSREVIEDSLRQTRWVKFNDEELLTLTTLLALPGSSASQQLAYLRQRYDLDLVALTRGADGCLIQTTTEEVDLPGIPVTVADTIGAGDSFTAALLVSTLQGQPLKKAAHFANRIAALVASKPGGTPLLTGAEINGCRTF